MVAGISDLLLNPDTFFEQISRERVNLTRPFAIVGIGMTVVFIEKTIPVVWILLMSPLFLASSNPAEIIGGLILCHTLIPLLVWGIISVGTYGISFLIGGRGTFAKTVQNTGYAMLPWTISAIISLVMSCLVFIIFHTGPYPQGDSIWWHIVFWSGEVTGLVFFLWECSLWIFSVRHTHAFTFRKAVAVTVLPIAVVVALTVPVLPRMEMITMALYGKIFSLTF